MTEDVPHGTNCAECPTTRTNNAAPPKSEYPASTQCFWCRKYLCALHAERPLGHDVNVRCCVSCGRKIAEAYRERDGMRFLAVPRRWPWRSPS